MGQHIALNSTAILSRMVFKITRSVKMKTKRYSCRDLARCDGVERVRTRTIRLRMSPSKSKEGMPYSMTVSPVLSHKLSSRITNFLHSKYKSWVPGTRIPTTFSLFHPTFITSERAYYLRVLLTFKKCELLIKSAKMVQHKVFSERVPMYRCSCC